jgi:asparagine synthase (glutamine-hydrolysing)
VCCAGPGGRLHIDADLIDRPKVGFRVPIGEWFRGRLRGEVEALLLSGSSHCRRWFDAAVIDELVEQHLSGSADRAKQLWPLVSLEVWAQTVLDPMP